MSMGSTVSVDEGAEQYREKLAELIAENAAAVVATGEMDRADAVQAYTNYYYQAIEAGGDVTGVSDLENTFPKPSRKAPPNQVAAIKRELMELARSAVARFPI